MDIYRLIMFGFVICFLMNFVSAETSTKVGTDLLYTPDNKFMSSTEDKISMIIPAIMIIISLISVIVDFGVIGICLGGMGAMVILSIIGIIALSWTSIAAYLILGLIIMFKVGS